MSSARLRAVVIGLGSRPPIAKLNPIGKRKTVLEAYREALRWQTITPLACFVVNEPL
jgi:hypothetical protein